MEENARKPSRKTSEVREDLFVLRTKMLSEMRAVLTPEQQQLLQERKAQHRDRMKPIRAWQDEPSE